MRWRLKMKRSASLTQKIAFKGNVFDVFNEKCKNSAKRY